MVYDYIIVGGGAAGCVLASRLSEDPKRSVLLIESGPDYPFSKGLPQAMRYASLPFLAASPGRHNWSYRGRVSDHADRTIPVPRGRIVGGSTTMHGQIFLRGLPEDFESWTRAGNDRWSFREVLPFYIRCENDIDFQNEYHGTQGPMLVRRLKLEEASPAARAFHQACLEAGFPSDPDHNLPSTTGVGPRPLNNADGVRISAAMAYLDPVRNRKNLTVHANSTARRILFSGRRATGVEIDRNGVLEIYTGGEMILSAGAIGSPHLLMLSGVGPKADLQKCGIPVAHQLEGVGQNLQDHPVVFYLFQARGGGSPFHKPSLQWELRTTSTGSEARNDIQVHLLAFHGGRHLPALLRMARRRLVPLLDIIRCGLRYVFLNQRQLVGFTVGLEHALSQGRVRILSADPKVHPEIQFRFLQNPEDRARLRIAARLAAKISRQKAFADFIQTRVIFPPDEVLESDNELDAWISQKVETQHHASGTCKMGPADDTMSVVDQFGRVHGLEGLRVVDASVMPSIISANTNATTIMIAERIAESMKGA